MYHYSALNNSSAKLNYSSAKLSDSSAKLSDSSAKLSDSSAKLSDSSAKLSDGSVLCKVYMTICEFVNAVSYAKKLIRTVSVQYQQYFLSSNLSKIKIYYLLYVH